MILVDSSAWVDYFSGTQTAEMKLLDGYLSTDMLCTGDIILAEILQGFPSNKEYRLVKKLLSELPVYQIMTPELALVGADNYRKLRKKGIAIRKSINNWIATFCIQNQVPLLFRDKDFHPYVDHLGLKKP